MPDSGRSAQPVLLALIVLLTLATGYIHFWVGSTMLLLNALGYAGLAGLTIGTAAVLRRAYPLALLMLAVYAGVTIIGWAILGPYFDVAYLAKGIEVALIVTVAITVRRMPGEPRASIEWALATAQAIAARMRRAPAAQASAAQPEE